MSQCQHVQMFKCRIVTRTKCACRAVTRKRTKCQDTFRTGLFIAKNVFFQQMVHLELINNKDCMFTKAANLIKLLRKYSSIFNGAHFDVT
jgi:hypothetical protein